MEISLLNGDCLAILKTFPSDGIHSLVTDPPAGISFMGKEWDDDKGGRKQWTAWMTEVMVECLRVLKPGAHGLVWAIPRTSHWTATALEDAGFEIRDVVTHLFGTGFPKSMDISKAIDKAAGAEREVISTKHVSRDLTRNGQKGDMAISVKPVHSALINITAPATQEAKQYSGWGTALKPASEHWILVRKPISEKTVAANVIKWGVGGLNIDECRIETKDNLNGGAYSEGERIRKETAWGGGVGGGVMTGSKNEYQQPAGRFPANLILDEEAGQMLDEQSGELKSGASKSTYVQKASANLCMSGPNYERKMQDRPADSGGASRFFYCAKASKSDKGADNTHPTVKSISLMSYLIKLVTPQGGVVLDPFMGSGSTGVAAKMLGFQFIGIEQNDAYFETARQRIDTVEKRLL